MYHAMRWSLLLPAVQLEAYPDAKIYGGSEKVQACTDIVKDKDTISIGTIQVRCAVFSTPALLHIQLSTLGAWQPLATQEIQSVTM
jgi:hypothetical protein